jgi:hypothetical protein
MRRTPRASRRGQAMVELALITPVFLAVVFGIISLGIGVFYQQQITNAAREAARYASVHSATAQCPTVSTLNPQPLPGNTYYRCDAPETAPNPWPKMTDAGRSRVFGLPSDEVQIVGCWSGYVDDATGSYDAPPTGADPMISTHWSPCRIDGHDPTTQPGAIGCSAGIAFSTVDTASDLSESEGRTVANQVTVYACYVWRPPLAGFLLIPSEVTLRAVIAEPIQRQQ